MCKRPQVFNTTYNRDSKNPKSCMDNEGVFALRK